MSDEQQPLISSAVSARDTSVNTFIARLFKVCGYDPHTLLEEINNKETTEYGWFNITLKNINDEAERAEITGHARRLFGKEAVEYNKWVMQIKYNDHHDELENALKRMISPGDTNPVFGTALQRHGIYPRDHSGDLLVKLVFALAAATDVQPENLIKDVFKKYADAQHKINVQSPYKVELLDAMDTYAKASGIKLPEQPVGNQIILGNLAYIIGNGLTTIPPEILSAYKKPARPLDDLKSLLKNRDVFLGSIANVDAKIKGIEKVEQITLKDDEGKEYVEERELPPEYKMGVHKTLWRKDAELKKWTDELLHYIEDVQRHPHNTGPVTRLLNSEEMGHLRQNLEIESKDMTEKYQAAPDYAKGEVVDPKARRWVREVLEAIQPEKIKKDVADYRRDYPQKSPEMRVP